ncbi:hypothetical protein QBC34DRAFT_376835 [Podospora aff. communis PSN243]|uniref:Myb-like domain-containing protein n=1 Tax=Podospora aff. communis PSN243 TaxID=3040156 RepID=A0AAV9H1V4_9PEZI|nr:hypothetical protein QBC34DRAFT_376835 [Podospora aff. communis PSN243]
MGGRGRGRPAARVPADPTAVAGRRSTRGQQQQQQQAQQQQEQQPDGDQQHQDPRIDPAITATQVDAMPPPPVPAPARGRSQEGRRVARRGAPRDNNRGQSLASIQSVPESSQEQEASVTPAPFPMPARDSSALNESPAFASIRRMMKKYLTKLKETSEDLAAHVLALPDSDRNGWENERKFLRELFRTCRSRYMLGTGGTIVDVDYVAESIPAPEDGPGRAHLHSVATYIASMSNIAFLLDEMSFTDPAQRLTILQIVDDNFLKNCIPVFPEQCITKNTEGNFILSDERIIMQVIEYRIQLMFLSLEKLQEGNSPYDPRETLREIFLSDDISIEQVEQLAADQSRDPPTLLCKDIPGINLGPTSWGREFANSRAKLFCKEIADLVQLSGGEWQSKFSALREAYSWDDFAVGFRQFLEDAFNEMKLLLDPGYAASQASEARMESQIQSQLEAEVNRHEDNAYSAFQAVAGLAQHRVAAGGGLSNQDILSHQIQSTYPPASSVPYPNFSAYSDPPVPPNGALYAQSAAQATAGGRKRRAPSGGDATPNSVKKPRGRRKQDAAPPSSAAPSSAQSGIPAGESQYPPPPSSAVFGDTDFEAVSQRSREISAANRKAREPQVRSAWVRNDVKQLVKAVDVYKCKWSTIEKEIKAGTIVFEIPRDQQALRDKARLLKQDFLKTDSVLPPSFDLVVLGKKEREAVKAVGKNPDRKEADIGPDGHPANTEYNPDEDLVAQPIPSATPAPVSEAEAVPAMPPAPMDAPHVEDDLDAEQVAA